MCLARSELRSANSAPIGNLALAGRRSWMGQRNPGRAGTKVASALAALIGACIWGHVSFCPAQPPAIPPDNPIYQRATNEFAAAIFYKPMEPRASDLGGSLAPLILQQVNDPQAPLSLSDQFGMLSYSNDAPVLDPSRPVIYSEVDTVLIKGTTLARCSYLWCYTPALLEVAQGQRMPVAAPGLAGLGLPLQGIRITLNAAGQPAIWEVLADDSRCKLLYVSQNLEAAAIAEFGRPLPGRRYATEVSPHSAPEAFVARVIDDSAVAAGPIVYLSADSRSVSTLICRCMPAQAKRLLATRTYELLPFRVVSTNSLILQARFASQNRAAFWPGDDPDGKQLAASLRLPEAFFSSRK
jgi:hypothetical protein